MTSSTLIPSPHNRTKHARYCAGRLAIAANILLHSTVANMAVHVEALRQALDAYDKAIVEETAARLAETTAKDVTDN